MKESDGTSVLDNAMIVYGNALGDGNRHNLELPVVLAGGGGGTLNPGWHLLVRSSTPMTNLYTAMLDRLGVKGERVGNSTGRLENIWVKALLLVAPESSGIAGLETSGLTLYDAPERSNLVVELRCAR